MIDVCICDDNANDIELLEGFIENFSTEFACRINILALQNPKELMLLKYDILFLDIHLSEDENGIDIGKKLRDNQNNCIINLVTSLREYSMDGYKADVLRFLVKPVTQEIVNEAMLASIKKLGLDRRVLKVRCIEGDTLFNLHDILYIESKQRKRKIVCRHGSYITWESFDVLQSKLSSPLFAFAHKSYLVNLEHIDYIKNGWIYLKKMGADNRAVIKISRGLARSFLMEVEKYIGGGFFE